MVAAIVIVILVGGAAFLIVELQQPSTSPGRSSVTTPAVTATVNGIATTGCQGCAPQVAVTAASLMSGDFLSTNAGTTFTCGSASGSFLTLSNTGTAGASVVAVTITWAGQTNPYSLAQNACIVGAPGSGSETQSLLFVSPQLATSATAGGVFTGTVTMSTGAVTPFTGTFQ